MKKKVLLSNLRIEHYAGSEIDTYTIAKYFLDEGYLVDIFTTDLKEPASKLFNKLKVRIITIDNNDQLYDNYDIAWIHHYPLLDYLIFIKKIVFKKIVYASLSSYVPVECAPIYHEELSIILANSFESLDKLLSEGVNKEKAQVFPNYAYKKYFKNKRKNLKLNKICIVSNHVPEELLEFIAIAEENNYVIDIYGSQGTKKFIDDKVLNDYDLIISIGKTVNYGIALSIPVYCYDRFGGPGYINKENLITAYENNFSGRGFNIKKTAEELFQDITDNYEKSLSNIEYLKEFGYDNFCFENNMKIILDKIKNMNDCNINKIYEGYSYCERYNLTYFEMVKLYNINSEYLQKEIDYLKNRINEVVDGYEVEITRLNNILKANEQEIEQLNNRLEDNN